MISITEAGQRSLDETRDEIESLLLADARAKAWDDWVAKMKAEVGVIYRKSLQPPITTPVEDTVTTAPAQATTSSQP